MNRRKFKRQNMIAIRDGSKGVKGLGIVNSLKVVDQNTGLLCRWEQLHGRRMQDEFSWGSLIFSTAISRGNKDFKSYKSTIFLYPKSTELFCQIDEQSVSKVIYLYLQSKAYKNYES